MTPILYILRGHMAFVKLADRVYFKEAWQRPWRCTLRNKRPHKKSLELKLISCLNCWNSESVPKYLHVKMYGLSVSESFLFCQMSLRARSWLHPLCLSWAVLCAFSMLLDPISFCLWAVFRGLWFLCNCTVTRCSYKYETTKENLF